ncbi:MAG: hypothetical protein JW745_09590 [Sedimentisphaerales bacterium]|nr:hypothetical protein [Sedimentisphaerales bacterium]MBN2844269.1 hypothetical protein [Sedimentisphaerales bacterium]
MDNEKQALIKQEITLALASEPDPANISRFFAEMLTESEMSNIVMRWELMKRLKAGVSQRQIAEELGLSLCKITRGSKILKDKQSVVARYLADLTEKAPD